MKHGNLIDATHLYCFLMLRSAIISYGTRPIWVSDISTRVTRWY